MATTCLGVAFRVHSTFGPGAMESIYFRALARGIEREGLPIEREVWIPVEFEGETFDRALRADLVVGGRLVLEVKATEEIHPAHARQVLSYALLGHYPLAYLLNFGAPHLRYGIRRFVNSRALGTDPLAQGPRPPRLRVSGDFP